MRTIFLWRAALLTLVPLLGVVGGAATIVAIATSIETIIIAMLMAMMMFIIPAARGFALAALLAAVSAAALVMHPFSRQQASFPKILRASEY